VATGRKQQIIIAIITILATIFSIGIVISNKVKAAKYVRTKATVVQSVTDVEYNSNIDGSWIYWVTYSFDVNGTTYTATRQEFSIFRKSAGRTAYIKYDPNNPEILENTLLEKTGVVMTLFFALVSAVLISNMRRK